MSMLYAGLDVSLEMTSICVVDADGRIVLETKVASDPEALACRLGELSGDLSVLGWRPVRCRNGFTSDCAILVNPRSASRPGMREPRSQP